MPSTPDQSRNGHSFAKPYDTTRREIDTNPRHRHGFDLVEMKAKPVSRGSMSVGNLRVATNRHSVSAFSHVKAHSPLQLAVAVCAMMCAASTVASAQLPVRPADPALSEISWGRPTAGDQLKVLFIAPRFTMRDAVLLEAHLDAEVIHAPIWSRTEIGGPLHHGAGIPDAGERETLKMLRDRLSKKHDLIVAANFDFRIFPDDLLGLLFERVGDGTGLLLANIDPTLDARLSDGIAPLADLDAFELVTRGIGERATPAWAAGLDFVYLATLGNGRVAWLDYPTEAPATRCLQPISPDLGFASDFSTTYFSLIARCAQWAGGAAPEFHIQSIDVNKAPVADEETVPVGLVLEEVEEMTAALSRSSVTRYDVTLSAPAEKRYTVRTRERRPGDPGHAIVVGNLPDHVSPGEDTFPVYVFAGNGDYFLDVWLLDNGKVADWFTHAVQVESWPRVVSIEFDRERVDPDGDIAINGFLELNPYQPRPCIVRARAFDATGGRVAETFVDIAPGSDRLRAVLDFNGLRGPVVRIEVAARDREGPEKPTPWEFSIASTEQAVLPVADADAIRRYELLTTWSVADQSVARDAFAALHRLGIDGVYLPAAGSAVFDAAGSGLTPMAGARMIRDIGRAGAEGESLFFNPRLEPLFEIVRSAGAYGASPFLLQPEAEPEVDSPAYLNAYQGGVEADYHRIDTLNAVWRTEFANWEDVPVPDRQTSIRERNYEPWMRYRTAAEESRAANWDIVAQLMRQSFDGARVGFDLSEPFPLTGIDWTTASAILTPPDHLATEKIRSYLNVDATGAVAFPEIVLESDQTFARWLPWNALFHGFARVVWPEAVGQADSVPAAILLDADGAPHAPVHPAFAEATRIKSGIGTLLLHAERDHCGIAVYDSQPSELIGGVEQSFDTGHAAAQRTVARLLESVGFQYDFVAPGAPLERYDVLFLPMARALSEDEVGAIRGFHANGGAIIADVAPGQFDEYGVPRDVLPFDDLFGIQHPRPVEAMETGETIVELTLADRRVIAELTDVIVDMSVEPIGGEVGGMSNQVPVWISHEEGNGNAWLLNHTLPAFRDPGAPNEQGLQILLDALLAERLHPAPAEVRVQDGYFGETANWRYGAANIVTLLAHPLQKRKEVKVSVRFGKDIRASNRLDGGVRMKKGPVDFALRPAEPAVVVSLPYEVRGLDLLTAPDIMPGEDLPYTATLDTGKTEPDKHLFRIDWTSPTGARFEHRTDFAETMSGEVRGTLRVAFNASEGPYTLRVTDLLSGEMSERIVQVQGLGRPPNTFTGGIHDE